MNPTYSMALGETAVDAVPKSHRVYFEVFGCQMNKLDAELMLENLTQSGYQLTHDPDEAGVILFNTCSVRFQAENRVISRMGTLKARKAREPELVLALTGCIAQHHEEKLFRRLPHLDLVVGTREFHLLPELIDETRGGERAPRLATAMDSPLEFQRTRNLGPNPHHAYVSVMRGCDMICSYCIVPTTRGKEVSRPPEVILAECRRLAQQGVKEITFLGQTVNSYGKRLGVRGVGLHTLLHGVEEIDGLERIRFITSHPRFMRPMLIDAMGECSKTCEYLHLPVQSGSDSMLARMKRTYDRERYLRVVERCRETIPGFSIATDFIVGFPGETDAEFEESLTLVREVGFDHGYVFKYSPRPGTEAHLQEDDVPEAVKKERNNILLDALHESALEKNQKRVGETVEVLIDGESKTDASRWTGRTRDHRIVVWPHRPEDRPGEFIQVRVEEATAFTLIGRAADESTSPAESRAAQ